MSLVHFACNGVASVKGSDVPSAASASPGRSSTPEAKSLLFIPEFQWSDQTRSSNGVAFLMQYQEKILAVTTSRALCCLASATATATGSLFAGHDKNPTFIKVCVDFAE